MRLTLEMPQGLVGFPDRVGLQILGGGELDGQVVVRVDWLGCSTLVHHRNFWR